MGFMFLRSSRRRTLGGAAFAAALLCLAPQTPLLGVATAASDLFAGLAGSWSGNGTLKLSNGKTERIRCQGTYAVGGDGDQLRQNLSCSSDSYDIKVTSNIDYKPDAGIVSGTWTEKTYNTVGMLSGRVRSGQIRASIKGEGFLAHLTMVTRGNQQSLTVKSSGTTVTDVSISLRRTSR